MPWLYSRESLRWTGVAASMLLAASGFLAGSPVHRSGSWIIGLVGWLVGAGALTAIWWRLRILTEHRWLLVTGALWAIPLLLAPPLGSHDVFAYACQGQLVQAGIDPYAAGPDALPCRWLTSVPALWRSTPAPYGPLWLAISGAAATLAGTSLPVAVTALRLAAIAGTVLAALAGTRLARRIGGDPRLVAWLAAIGPLTLVHVVSGAHNDAVLAGLVVAAFNAGALARPTRVGVPNTAWHRRYGRLVLVGAVLGLAATVKVTALVAAPFAIFLVLPPRAPARQLAGASVVLAGGCVAAYAVVAGVTGHGLGFIHGLSGTTSMVQWLSLPTGTGMAVGYVLRVAGEPAAFAAAVAVARLVGLAALAVVVALLYRRAWRDGPVAAVTGAGVALLAVAVLGPVFYAWYAIGGLALLATAPLPARTERLAGAGAAALVFLTLPDGLGLATKTKVPGAFLDLAVVVLLATAGWARWRARPAAGTSVDGGRISRLVGRWRGPARPARWSAR